MKSKLYIIHQFAFVLVLTLCNWSASFGQVNMTKIKDGSVASATTPVSGAVLELESTNRGFLAPRLTTVQRDAIATANRVDGLLIYNTTEGCFNHWSVSQGMWLSICGTPPPAVFSISATQCSAIQVSGTYKQGDALTTSNYLSIPVTVTQAGNYSVSATTTNGYYFEKTGNFPAAGNYTILLPGIGTPNNASPAPGDSVSISLNGIANSCSPKIIVASAAVSYTISCGTLAVEGAYNIGIPLTTSNTITLDVNVAALGFWSVNTGSATINGYKFSGTGTFTTLGTQSIQIVGTGTPIAAGTNNFTIFSNSITGATCTPVPVTVAPVTYTMNCASATVNGSYSQDVALTASNTITLPVNVTATGTTTISTNTANGMTFSTGSITFSALGAQNVTLSGTGTPTGPATTAFTLTGTPGGAATCSVNVTVEAQPLKYDLVCAGITTTGTYNPGKATAATNTMVVPVNVQYVGAYTISTNTQDGFSFSASGTFTATGTQNVILAATGTPTVAGVFTFTITANGAGTTKTCTKAIEVQFRPMVVLGIGDGMYQPGSANANQTSRAVLVSENNFGLLAASKVKVPKFVLGTTTSATQSALINGSTPNESQLTTYINTNNVDIIVIGYNWSPNTATRAVLIDFIKNKKGVVINFSENDNGSRDVARDLYSVATINRNTYNGGGALYQFANISDPILNGIFGDVKGLYWGEDASATDHLTNLPGGIVTYTTTNTGPSGSGSGVTCFRDATLGYLWAGDGGFVAGDRTNTSNDSWPAKNDGGSNPIPKTAANTGSSDVYGQTGYGGPKPVYNSVFYANALAWAVGYVQTNKP